MATATRAMRITTRVLALVIAALMAVPLALVTCIVLTEPPTWSAAAYVLGADACVAAMLLAGRPLARRLAVVGVASIAVTMLLRVLATPRGVMSVSGTGDARVVDRLVDERDLSVNGARALRWTHFMGDPDVPELAGAMRTAYDEMAQDQADTPSPVVATYLGLERPGASDVVELPAEGGADRAVVFLHGYAGSFTMPCWLFARAARRAHVTTVCPATRWVGDWWSPDGEAIVRETLAALRARGFAHVTLAGLSNGAIGASRLAPRIRGFEGLILIAGAAPDAAPPGIPTLVVQGRSDAQIPARLVHAYAQRAGARYVELDAGHFAMLVRKEQATDAIAAWLSRATHSP